MNYIRSKLIKGLMRLFSALFVFFFISNPILAAPMAYSLHEGKAHFASMSSGLDSSKIVFLTKEKRIAPQKIHGERVESGGNIVNLVDRSLSNDKLIVGVSCLTGNGEYTWYEEMVAREILVKRIRGAIKDVLTAGEQSNLLKVGGVLLSDGLLPHFQEGRAMPIFCPKSNDDSSTSVHRHDFQVEIGGSIDFEDSQVTFSPKVYFRGFSEKVVVNLPPITGHRDEENFLPNEVGKEILRFAELTFPFVAANDSDFILELERTLRNEGSQYKKLITRGSDSYEQGVKSHNDKKFAIAEIFFELALANIRSKYGNTLRPEKLSQDLAKNLSQLAQITGQIRRKKGRVYEALQLLEASVSFDNSNVNSMKSLAELYENLGDYSSAIMNYLDVLENEPTDKDVRLSLGLLYLKTRDFKGAEIQFRTIYDRDHQNGEAMSGLYEALMGLADQKFRDCQVERSEKHLREAISLKKELSWAHLNLAEILLLTDKFNQVTPMMSKFQLTTRQSEISERGIMEQIGMVLITLAQALDGDQSVVFNNLSTIKPGSIPTSEWDFRYIFVKLNKHPRAIDFSNLIKELEEINNISPWNRWQKSDRVLFGKCFGITNN